MSASKALGGDLGRVEPSDLNPALSSAIASLRPGEVSAPIPVEAGYWVLKVRERMADEVTAFDQVKERLQEELSRGKMEKVYGDYIADLKKNAVYTVYVREAPTQIGRAKARPAATPVPVNADEEITTTGSAAPERITVPNTPIRPTPTPTPLPR